MLRQPAWLEVGICWCKALNRPRKEVRSRLDNLVAIDREQGWMDRAPTFRWGLNDRTYRT